MQVDASMIFRKKYKIIELYGNNDEHVFLRIDDIIMVVFRKNDFDVHLKNGDKINFSCTNQKEGMERFRYLMNQ